MAPFQVKADPGGNVLRSHFRGIVRGADMAATCDRLQPILSQLAPGFTLITDLTDLESMDIDCVPNLTRFMDACRAAGVAKVVRVIPHPDKDIGFKLLSLTHYRGKVRIVTVATRQEAEREIAK